MPLTPEQRSIIERNRQAAIAKRTAILDKQFWDRTRVQWNRVQAQKKRRAIVLAKIEANRQAAIAKRRDILMAPEMKRDIARENWLLTNEKRNFKPNQFPWMTRKKYYYNLRFNAGYWRNEARKALYAHKPWSQMEYKYCMNKAALQDWKAQQIANNYNVFRRK